MLYTGLLSSLGKTILLQAETEVTAEKKAAIPLAQVAFTLLDRLETFPDIFFAKLVQRCGGWPIPCAVPDVDFDGTPWADDAQRIKMMGYRRSVEQNVAREPMVEYMNRVAGDMRLYFHILKIPPQTRPMHPMFQLPRCWTWFARIMADYPLLETPVAAQLIYSAYLFCWHYDAFSLIPLRHSWTGRARLPCTGGLGTTMDQDAGIDLSGRDGRFCRG